MDPGVRAFIQVQYLILQFPEQNQHVEWDQVPNPTQFWYCGHRASTGCCESTTECFSATSQVNSARGTASCLKALAKVCTRWCEATQGWGRVSGKGKGETRDGSGPGVG